MSELNKITKKMFEEYKNIKKKGMKNKKDTKDRKIK